MKKIIAIALVALLAIGATFAQGLQEETASFPDPEKTITIIVRAHEFCNEKVNE